MSKLLYADFRRMSKTGSFWLCAGFMLAAGLFVALKTSDEFPLERTFFSYTLIIGLVSSVFCALFIGSEHSDGTLRNKLIVGHTKASVYFSALTAACAAGFIFCLSFILPMLAVGIPRLGFFTSEITNVLALFGVSLALSAAFSCIFVLISLSLRNKAVIAIACVLGFIALLCLGAVINSRLQEPEIIDSYVADILGIGNMTSEPNPEYISGTERIIYQFFLDFLPGGQALQFTDMSIIHLWQLPVYSLVICVLTTFAGVTVFKNKNIY